MKILFLTDNFPPESNAPAVRTLAHARRWADAGHDVTIVTGAPNFPEGEVYDGYDNAWRSVDHVDGVRVVRVKTYISANEGTVKRILDYVSFMASGTLMALFEERPDVVVATSPQFFTSIGGYVLSRLRRVPFVFEVRDLWPASIVAVGAMKKSWAIERLEDLELFLYKAASAIVVVTSAFKEDLVSRGIDPAKISVVLNGVDKQMQKLPRDAELDEQLGLRGKFVAAYIGTHGMAHSLETVAQAAELLKDKSEIAFLFVGSGAARDNLLSEIDKRGLTNVRTLPRQPRERLPEIWSLCDVGLIPLRATPVFSTVIPSKLFELSSQGIPMLMAIPEGEATRMLRESEAGDVIQPEDPKGMADAIVRLSQDRERQKRLASHGISWSKAFSRDVMANKMLEVLQQVVAGRTK